MVLNHDRDGCELADWLHAHERVGVVLGPGGRGDAGLVLRWLDAARWLGGRGVTHVVTISGQDYPLRPLPELHRALAESGDGFAEHFPVLRAGSHWPLREGRSRYLYSWRSLRPLGPRAKARLRPLQLVNRLQPWWRVNVSYDRLRVGRRTGSGLPAGWEPWGGSFFTNLSWRAVERVLAAAEDESVMAWARRSLVVDEAFLQTVLVNDGSFALVDTAGRYYDFSGTRHGSPRTLATLDDVRRARASGAFFGRKWDPDAPEQVWATLDAGLAPSAERSPEAWR
ncbi:hypothetical protein [Nocardioides sp. 616]|uniref:hypothetical protein n=1 Tax=Nocardioides sp. 616 TaxID=2268090 RepID=UPI000CE4CA3A|nr:hypothetical protein [Nocardioides sp. 616]